MVNPQEDLFVVTSSTALGMAEDLMRLLSTIMENLPEAELRRIRGSLERSINDVDDLLLRRSVFYGFKVFSIGEGACTSVVGYDCLSPR